MIFTTNEHRNELALRGGISGLSPLHLTAIHEAAHAVAASDFGVTTQEVTVVPAENYLGRCCYASRFASYNHQVRSVMAGMMAEDIWLNDMTWKPSPGWMPDWERGGSGDTRIILAVLEQRFTTEAFTYSYYKGTYRKNTHVRKQSTWLDEQAQETYRLLTRPKIRNAVATIAYLLMKHGTLCNRVNRVISDLNPCRQIEESDFVINDELLADDDWFRVWKFCSDTGGVFNAEDLTWAFPIWAREEVITYVAERVWKRHRASKVRNGEYDLALDWEIDWDEPDDEDDDE